MGRRARRVGREAPAPPRERRERPGAVLRGPPIAVRCDCGSKHDLAYGERWRCEQCGRTWDTKRIPFAEYDAIRRTQLRFRVLPVLLGLLVAALAIFFTLTGNVWSVFFLLPLAMTTWFVFVRPSHRKRYRRAIADLPKWTLDPE